MSQASEVVVPEPASEIPPRASQFNRMVRVFFRRKLAAAGFVILCIFAIVAAFGPLFAPFDPYKQDLKNALLDPSRTHLLGTDPLGRDTLSRIIYGARTAVLIAAIAVGIAVTLGNLLGLLAGYGGLALNMVIMRFIDALMAFPMILLALVLGAMLGGGLKNIMIALGISMMSGYARMMCGQVLSARANDYVLAAESIGATRWRIMIRHLLPNCFPPLLVMVSMQVGAVIMAEAGLSFLGLGIDPPGAAWGSMVNTGYTYLLTHPVLSFAPGLCILLVVFGANVVGDGLRDALDPRLRGTL
jgi:peptide/nickel transport system permease protein